MTVRNHKIALALLPATLALSVPAFAGHPHNIIERHPTATGFAAGVATHHLLKVEAARDKARGKKLNFAERHPTMSGLGVGVFTRHEIKKHTPR
jgi:hypothetical protein